MKIISYIHFDWTLEKKKGKKTCCIDMAKIDIFPYFLIILFKL